jgi:IS5 family transposase
VDATIINAPSSTKNREGRRDPEMHQTRKGKQWYFGMKAHIGVDADTRLIHSVATTSAKVHDSQVIGALLHGEESGVWGDSAYRGQGKAIREVAPRAREFIQEKGVSHRPLSEVQKARNRIRSKVRSKVEHPFQIMKRVFGFTQVRYRGLVKNTHRVQVTCALVNLFLVRKRLLKPALAME